MIAETTDIQVAKPCPKCNRMPIMLVASGWHIVKCPQCGMQASVPKGDTEDAIRAYNKMVEDMQS